jgi:hypothetical protein
MSAVYSGGYGCDPQESLEFRLHEVFVMRKGEALTQGAGICYASERNPEPAHALGRALGRLMQGDGYTIVQKPIGRSALTGQPK